VEAEKVAQEQEQERADRIIRFCDRNKPEDIEDEQRKNIRAKIKELFAQGYEVPLEW
jgi:hypothetical protein